MLLPPQSYCTYCGHHPVFSHPHFNAMMMSFCSISNICLDEAARTSSSTWGPWHSNKHHQFSLLLYIALHKILPPCFLSRPASQRYSYLYVVKKGHCQSPLQDKASYCQKAWDTPRIEAISAALLDQSSHAITRARLLAVSTKESGAWLHAVPNSSLGLRMDNEMIRVAVGLRLGVSSMQPTLVPALW